MLHFEELTSQERRIYKRWLRKNKIWDGGEVIHRLTQNGKFNIRD